MLDIQRHRKDSLRSEVRLARYIVGGHLSLGAAGVLLLLLHEVFAMAAAAGCWYLISLMAVCGVMSGRAVWRHVLGGAFVLFALGGVYFLGQVLPTLKMAAPPLLSLELLPFWLGVFNLAYLVGGLVVLGSSKIRKAATIGFKLW